MKHTKLDFEVTAAVLEATQPCAPTLPPAPAAGVGQSFALTPPALALALGACLGLALSACDSGAAAPASAASATSGSEETKATPGVVGAVTRRGSGSVSAEMGPAGGRLELSEGPRVVIPAGVVTDAAEFVLQTATLTTAFSNEELERAVGPTFSFAPGVEASGAPIEVSMPMPSVPDGWGEPALAYEYPISARVGAEDSVHTKWQYENARLSGGRVTAQVDALPGMRLQFVLSNLAAQ